MDDFIYILALIAWIVFAFYRKSQKKKDAASETRRQPQTRPQTQEETKPFPTIEDILSGVEAKLEQEPEPEPEPAFNDIPSADGVAPILAETSFEKEYNLQGITSIEEMDKILRGIDSEAIDIQEDEEEDEDIEGRDWLKKIDLKRAVIYSEILNRPYV